MLQFGRDFIDFSIALFVGYESEVEGASRFRKALCIQESRQASAGPAVGVQQKMIQAAWPIAFQPG